ncbi:MAG: Cas10/Cmr2 second palm domain-containing protein [Egibacteraceae bacterium]
MTVLAYLGLPSPQAFIARARKARDAWTASFLYAWLMYEALAFLTDGWPDARVLQPHFDRDRLPELRASLPNTAVIRFDELDEARTALRKTEELLTALFAYCGRRVRALLRPEADGGMDETRWAAQIATFPEVLWCAVEAEPGEDADSLAARAASVWEARRHLRDRVRFAPGAAGVFGCTMCGRREAAITDPDAAKRLAGRLPRDFRRAEGLCAVCLVVRFAFAARCFKTTDGFGVPSVATVAAGPWLPDADRALRATESFGIFVEEIDKARWRDPHPNPLRGQKAHRELVGLLGALYGVDPPEPPPGTGKDAWEKKIKSALDWRGELLSEARVAPPPKRYALVAYDGDGIGAFFRSLRPGQREDASRRLAGFGVDVAPQIVESPESLGALLYAGGDDGRFFVPLDRALGVLDALRKAFTQAMGDGHRLTLSAGVAVAEVRHPLDLVVEAAHYGRDVAKAEYGRDALCVVWLTGEGARLAGGQFGEGASDLISDLGVVADAFTGPLSRSLATTLEDLARQWEPPVPAAVFADLARERLLESGQTPAVEVIDRWLDALPPPRAAGLVRLARDLAGVEV